jgi:hypothetical protein
LRPEQARRLLSSSILVGVIFPSEKGRLRVDSNTRSKLSIFGQRIVCQHAFEALNRVLLELRAVQSVPEFHTGERVRDGHSVQIPSVSESGRRCVTENLTCTFRAVS